MESETLFLIARVGFPALTLAYFGLLMREMKNGIGLTSWTVNRKRRTIAWATGLLCAWVIFVAIWSGSGMMMRFSIFPFNFMPILLPPLVAVIILTVSPGMTTVLGQISPARIIRLQSFRFFVELLLWALFAAHMLPEQMTFEGMNFDILAGITAPVVALLVARQRTSRAFVIAWNIICLGLLINIVTIAILSTPSPIRVFMEEPSNTVVAAFPISLLPGLLVPLAYTLHVFSLKQFNSKTIAPDRPREAAPLQH